MISSTKPPVLVVLQLSGGNDALNTIVPYTNPLYMDNRPAVSIAPQQVLPIDDSIGFHPAMGPIKQLYDAGQVAIIQGIGYPNPNRSHFRSMDIWHTGEPEKVGTEGWLGRAIRDLDPNKENVLTGVNFGRGLPRALAAPGVPVASVGALETYGVLTSIRGQDQRTEALEMFATMYTPMLGHSVIKEYISQTGADALQGADILSVAPQKYASTVQYEGNSVAQSMKNIAQVHLAGLGTRVLYTIAPADSFDATWGKEGSGPGEFSMPWGIDIDQEGYIYVADWRNDRVQKFTADGQFVMQLGTSGTGEGELNRPAGVAVDQDGIIYVTDWGNNRLQVFDADGRFILVKTGDATISRWGKEKLDANAEMWQERERAQGLEREKLFWGLVAVEVDDEKRIFVAETARSRIKVYRKQAAIFSGSRL